MARTKWQLENPEQIKIINKRARRKLKVDALRAYSNDNPRCCCCGESEVDFLCLDHINNNGSIDRKIRGGGNTFFFWLRKNKYPQELKLQVLCYNCNNSKKINGYCIHKK